MFNHRYDNIKVIELHFFVFGFSCHSTMLSGYSEFPNNHFFIKFSLFKNICYYLSQRYFWLIAFIFRNHGIIYRLGYILELYITVFIVAKISKGEGTSVLSNSFERTSTERELLPFLTLSSRKLGLVRI